jgi:hypothetical protein
MKKAISTLVLVISTLVCFSCSNDSVDNSIDSNQMTLSKEIASNNYDLIDLIDNPLLIGEIHNQEMDNIYNSLASMKNNGLNSNKGIDEYVEFEIVENLTSKINFGTITDLGNFNYVDVEILRDGDSKINKILDFESELQNLLDLDLTITEFNLQAELIFNNYKDLFSDDFYKKSILIIYSVSISSNTYWDNNFEKWEKLFINSEFNNRRGVSDAGKGRIVKADISGAVRGAITGGIGGAIAGGIGAVPGAIIGACISSSVGSAAAGIREYLGYSTWNPF